MGLAAIAPQLATVGERGQDNRGAVDPENEILAPVGGCMGGGDRVSADMTEPEITPAPIGDPMLNFGFAH